ncbi:unnamed protein product [Plutella xylostella]|uniref:(diamondback moth) hypothetical protein n=1 Tax=Plutella xylostella TaxID=51655 RepID=A0A8S4GFH7_PLUXY|nr:unnamed protein product [Plutella xylostella]
MSVLTSSSLLAGINFMLTSQGVLTALLSAIPKRCNIFSMYND